jgi:ketosteroid isomerase-like protein
VISKTDPLLTNQSLVWRLFVEAINKGDLAVLDELYDPNCVERSAFSWQAPGPAAIHQAITEVRSFLPDLQVTVEEMKANVDEVITRESWRGTNAATGEQIVGTVTHIFRIQNKLIVEEWSGGWEWLDQLGNR